MSGASQDRVIAGALMALGAVAAGIRFNDQFVGLTGDNAEYILLGRDLLTGQTYGNAGFPWGYPALLTPVLATVGTDNLLAAIPWLKLLTIVLYVVSLPIMYVFFRTRQGPALAFVVAMLFAVNSTTLLYANDVMTELPYTCASFGALLYWQKAIAPWAADREARPVPWGRLALAGVLFLFPYYIRTVGVAILVAPVLVLLLYRKWRAAAAFGLALTLGALPWLLWSRGGTVNNYANQLLSRDPYNPSLGSISSVGEMLGRVWSALWLYITQIFPLMVLPDPTPPSVQSLFLPILAVLVLIGLLAFLVRRVELPEVYAPLFVLVLSIWPFKADRFLLPIYPLLLLYAIEGGAWLARLAARLSRGRWPMDVLIVPRPHQLPLSSIVIIALAALLALPNLYWAGVAGAENMRYLRGQGPISGHTPDWDRYFAACNWLKENTPPGSVIMSRKSTLTELYADRPSVQIPLIAPEDYPAFMRDNHVSYILEDGFKWSTHTRNYLRPALAVWPEKVQLAKTFGPPTTRVWKVVGAPE